MKGSTRSGCGHFCGNRTPSGVAIVNILHDVMTTISSIINADTHIHIAIISTVWVPGRDTLTA